MQRGNTLGDLSTPVGWQGLPAVEQGSPQATLQPAWFGAEGSRGRGV